MLSSTMLHDPSTTRGFFEGDLKARCLVNHDLEDPPFCKYEYIYIYIYMGLGGGYHIYIYIDAYKYIHTYADGTSP